MGNIVFMLREYLNGDVFQTPGAPLYPILPKSNPSGYSLWPKTQCNSSLCSWWVVHRRPVALAKLFVHTHHLSLFQVPWRLIFFSRPEYSWKIARWTLNINQSIKNSVICMYLTDFSLFVWESRYQILKNYHNPLSAVLNYPSQKENRCTHVSESEIIKKVSET